MDHVKLWPTAWATVSGYFDHPLERTVWSGLLGRAHLAPGVGLLSTTRLRS